MPMFPLGTVLFPHALLPLHVFEPRYRADDRSACCATTASSASCSSSAAARSAAATRASTSAPSRGSCARRSCPTAATRSRPSGSGGSGSRAGSPTIRTRTRRSSTSPSRRTPDAADGRHGLRARARLALDDVCALYRRLDRARPRPPGDRRRGRAGVVRDGGARADRSARRAAGARDRARRAIGSTLLAELLDEHARVLRAATARLRLSAQRAPFGTLAA